MKSHIQHIPADERQKAWDDFSRQYRREVKYVCWGDIGYDDSGSSLALMVGVCKECGCPVDKDGDALRGCYYSTTTCEACGFQSCDGSC